MALVTQCATTGSGSVELSVIMICVCHTVALSDTILWHSVISSFNIRTHYIRGVFGELVTFRRQTVFPSRDSLRQPEEGIPPARPRDRRKVILLLVLQVECRGHNRLIELVSLSSTATTSTGISFTK